MRKKLLLPTALLVLTSCAPKETERIIEKQTIIQQEFAQVKEEPLVSETNSEKQKASYHIEMRKGFLKSEFLLSTSGIQVLPAPQGHSFANKIIYFEIKDETLYMFESLKGKLVTDSIKTKLLLAEFPIVSRTPKTITFDFKSGLKHILFKGSNFTSERSQEVVEDNYIEITTNYIEKIELRNNHLLIDQTFRYNDKKQNESGVYQLKFSITPYKVNPRFSPVETNSQKEVGYFETHPVLEAPTGRKTINIVKFDTSKPIVYSLTKNIPKEYEQAIKDGILYWNKVFGRNVIKVEELPSNVSVHEPGYNVVQWLKYDSAGFAYAQLQSDPLTGENLQSHVYMTSVFGLGHYADAEKIYKRLKAKNKKQKSFSFKNSSLKEMKICQHDSRDNDLKTFERLFKRLEDKKFNHTEEEKQKIYKRYAQDYVRQVIAHEIGHTLGLRHNFAGSLQNNLNPEAFQEESQNYFLTGNLHEDVNLTGTVMDYTPGMMSSMIGAHIRLKRPAFSYDKQAISWGYDQIGNPRNFDLFCTDGDKAKKYIDCKVWDSYKNAFESAQFEKENTPKLIAAKVIRMFSFLNRGLNKTKEDEINELQLDPLKDAKNLIKYGLAPLLEATHSKAEFIKIKKGVKNYTSSAPQIYKQETEKYKSEEIAMLGGLTKSLLSPLMLSSESNRVDYINTVEQLILNDFDKTYKYSSSKVKELAKKKISIYLENLEKAFVEMYTKSLHTMQVSFDDKDYLNELEKIVESLLLQTTEEVLGEINGHNVLSFKYSSMSTRKNIAQLIKKVPFDIKPSVTRKQKKIKENLSAKHKEYMKNMLGTVNIDELNDDMYDWYINETRVINSL